MPDTHQLRSDADKSRRTAYRYTIIITIATLVVILGLVVLFQTSQAPTPQQPSVLRPLPDNPTKPPEQPPKQPQKKGEGAVVLGVPVLGAVVLGAVIVFVVYRSLRYLLRAERAEKQANVLEPREALENWRQAGFLIVSDEDLQHALQIYTPGDLYKFIEHIVAKEGVDEDEGGNIQLSVKREQHVNAPPLVVAGSLSLRWTKTQSA